MDYRPLGKTGLQVSTLGFGCGDYLLNHTQQQQMGVIAIRALAAGALSGSESRHHVAVPTVRPIASGPDYATDMQHARRFHALVEAGYVSTLVEVALRFTAGNPAISTMLLGYSSFEHLELAADYVARGPLPQAAIEQVSALWTQMARG